LLEQDIIPLFYNRGRDGLPRRWISKIKSGMRKLAPYFNTRRMVQEYTQQYYMPNFKTVQQMTQGDMKEGLAFSAWRSKLDKAWRHIHIRSVEIPEKLIKVGSEIEVTALVDLGQLTPKDVRVQLFYGQLNTQGYITNNAQAVDMIASGVESSGTCRFTAKVQYVSSGERGISVRVLPYHPYLHTSFLPGLITWANS
jgi:starch phosphorylase